MTELRENEIQRQILDYLKLRGIPAWRNQSGFVRIGSHYMHVGTTGSPDIVGVLPASGRFLAVEVKAEGEKLTDVQSRFLLQLKLAGALVIVAMSIEDIEKELKRN